MGEQVPNNGYYEFSIKKNWAVEMNRARKYKLGAVAVTIMTGGTKEPKYVLFVTLEIIRSKNINILLFYF